MKYIWNMKYHLVCFFTVPVIIRYLKEKLVQTALDVKHIIKVFCFERRQGPLLHWLRHFFYSFSLLNSFWFLNIVPVLLFCLNFKCLVTSSTQSFRNVWSYTPPLTRYCLFFRISVVFGVFFLFKGTEIINKKVEWNDFENEKILLSTLFFIIVCLFTSGHTGVK